MTLADHLQVIKLTIRLRLLLKYESLLALAIELKKDKEDRS